MWWGFSNACSESNSVLTRAENLSKNLFHLSWHCTTILFFGIWKSEECLHTASIWKWYHISLSYFDNDIGSLNDAAFYLFFLFLGTGSAQRSRNFLKFQLFITNSMFSSNFISVFFSSVELTQQNKSKNISNLSFVSSFKKVVELWVYFRRGSVATVYKSRPGHQRQRCVRGRELRHS